ncbi:small integral membrane protein 1 [Glossophaga mutica]
MDPTWVLPALLHPSEGPAPGPPAWAPGASASEDGGWEWALLFAQGSRNRAPGGRPGLGAGARAACGGGERSSPLRAPPARRPSVHAGSAGAELCPCGRRPLAARNRDGHPGHAGRRASPLKPRSPGGSRSPAPSSRPSWRGQGRLGASMGQQRRAGGSEILPPLGPEGRCAAVPEPARAPPAPRPLQGPAPVPFRPGPPLLALRSDLASLLPSPTLLPEASSLPGSACPFATDKSAPGETQAHGAAGRKEVKPTGLPGSDHRPGPQRLRQPVPWPGPALWPCQLRGPAQRRPRPRASMQPQDLSVQYSRWEEVSMGAASSAGAEEASVWEGLSPKLCSGKLGVAMKVLGGVALFWVTFILGYVTGYFIHKCK